MKFVLDTNIYLHYKLFTERDWKTLLGCDDLTLVVPPAVIEELDEKKYTAPDTRIKRRAQEVISKFKEISEGDSIPPGFQVNFLESTIESVDWVALRLNPSNNDDRIIGATLALKHQNTDEEVLIIAADFGMKLKAKAYGIKVVNPPEDWRREIMDPRDKEIAELRAELQKIQNAMPEIQLFLSVGDEIVQVLKISRNEILKGILSDEDIKEKLDQERQELESIGVVNPILLNPGIIPKKEIKRYDGEVSSYMEKYLKYLNDVKMVQELRLTIEISPVLINNGSLPAEDIDIFLGFPHDWLDFPNDIKLMEEADLPKFPKKPMRPTPPQSVSGFVANLAHLSSLFRFVSEPIHPYVNSRPVKQIGPEINKSEISVHYWLKNLKHGMEWRLKPVYVWYSSVNVVNTFQIEYSIHIGNHPVIKEGNLSVIIRE